MKLILPSGHVVLIDDADMPVLDGRIWHADRRDHTVYVRGRRPKQQVGGDYLHNLILGGLADHIDGNGLDCRRSNLRLATQAQNCLNRSAKKGKRFKGVYRSSSRYYAEIYFKGERRASYGHATEEGAARAYDAMAVELHGEFARLNFPDLEQAS